MGNPLVRKVTFTDSTEVGKQLMKQGGDQLKKLSLELGGGMSSFLSWMMLIWIRRSMA
ncbi:aldehyde dehydrogenase family protein [Salibacterium salarium]|uniref:aldehyde dehydrogenase family protein n=1 Tax=Salibacterium salarium TaxID=284579 RepID=UPI00351FF260